MNANHHLGTTVRPRIFLIKSLSTLRSHRVLQIFQYNRGVLEYLQQKDMNGILESAISVWFA